MWISGIKVLFTLTLLSLAPSILLLMTCFTRVAIVLSFIPFGPAIAGCAREPDIIGLSLFITYFVMAPSGTASTPTPRAVSAKQIHQPGALDPRQP